MICVSPFFSFLAMETLHVSVWGNVSKKNGLYCSTRALSILPMVKPPGKNMAGVGAESPSL